MFRSTSHVRTESAARYVNRLCKHWGHKFEVELTPERGFIDFGDSNCELLAHPDHVLMILNSPDEDSLAHMQNVVADHLQRMANSESLEIAWQPAESSPRRHPAALRGRASRGAMESAIHSPEKPFSSLRPRPIIPSRRSRADNNNDWRR
ncbi:DUF2218 domain-containing protein [Pseudomonas aeruginosa]|nr:DUF2218 domain-containing protein [Pseudomonas aeruginosa]